MELGCKVAVFPPCLHQLQDKIVGLITCITLCKVKLRATVFRDSLLKDILTVGSNCDAQHHRYITL